MQKLTDVMDPFKTRLNLLFSEPGLNRVKILEEAFPNSFDWVPFNALSREVFGSCKKYTKYFPGYKPNGGTGSQHLAAVINHTADGHQHIVSCPEAWLHPEWQLGLGDLFIHLSKKYPLIVETDSEHLMLRVLRRIRETGSSYAIARADLPRELQLHHEDVCCVYVHEDDQTHELVFTSTGIDSEGYFTTLWPKGFFEERGEEFF